MHNIRVTTLAEVNHFVINQYKAFMNSEIGKEQRQFRTACATEATTEGFSPAAVLTACLYTSSDRLFVSAPPIAHRDWAQLDQNSCVHGPARPPQSGGCTTNLMAFLPLSALWPQVTA